MDDLLPEKPIEIDQERFGSYLNWLIGAYGTPGIDMNVGKTEDPQILSITVARRYKAKSNTSKSDLKTHKW